MALWLLCNIAGVTDAKDINSGNDNEECIWGAAGLMRVAARMRHDHCAVTAGLDKRAGVGLSVATANADT